MSKPRQAACPSGHAFTDENTYVAPDGVRGCRACRHRSSVEYRARLRQQGHRQTYPGVETAKTFVAEVNARTVCAHCGAAKIEWHNPEHVELNRENFRMHRMVALGRPVEVIQAEMDRCTPLCRRCHMAEDGRLALFGRTIRGPVTPARPCTECSRLYKPLRRGLCETCANRKYKAARAISRRCLDCGLVHLCPLPFSACACTACGSTDVETA